MKTAEQVVEQIWEDNQALYRASELQIKAFYDSAPKKEKLVENFTRRMVNERMNLTGIMKAVVTAEVDTDPKELMSLCKQALDEANHFRMVRDVVEYISGEPVDLGTTVPKELANTFVKGGKLLKKYDCENDPIALALYQAIAEGQASRNWQMMADCLKDPYLANTYGKIAADERFHSKLGRLNLTKLLDTQEKQEYALELADQMRKDMFQINCNGTMRIEESRKMIDEYYGEDWALDAVDEFRAVPMRTIYKETV
jgi:1,2-phenylacetyl-CoA epoxidase catalytic subunit